MNSSSTAGEFNQNANICDYLYNIVFNHKPGGPEIPSSFDYAYVEKTIERELQNLGCKHVKAYIGPKTVTESKPFGKKSFLGGIKYHDINLRVIKWLISISW